MENNKNTKNKVALIAGAVGVAIGLMWQFGGPLLTDGPLGGVIRKARNAAPVTTTWEYREEKDPATGKPIKGAVLNSMNTADTGFGPAARLRLILTESNKQKIVAVKATMGIPQCASSPADCSVALQFNNGPVEKTKAYYAKRTILFEDSERLFARIKDAKTVKVGVIFVSSGGKARKDFDFKTAGLSWKD